MKNLARLIIVLFATQMLITGIARAAVVSTATDQKSHVCAMPDNDPYSDPTEGF